VRLRAHPKQGGLTIHSPDHPEFDGKTLEEVWKEGWRPARYFEGEVTLILQLPSPFAARPAKKKE